MRSDAHAPTIVRTSLVGDDGGADDPVRGAEVVLQPGDIYLVEPGHDSWVSSDEPCVSSDLIPPGE